MDNIDQEGINNFKTECNEHPKKNIPYSRYCRTCKKDICNNCFKQNHKNHKIEKFEDLDLDDEEYKELEVKENKMKLLKEELSKKQDEIKMFSSKVQQLTNIINIINDLLENIKVKFEEINSNLKKNEKIIEYYNKNQYNYEILKKIKSLRFITNAGNLNLDILYEKINEFKLITNQIDTQKQITNFGSPLGLPMSGTPKGEINEKNMWISENYCKNWGLKEGIREFLQNQYDEIITEIKSKENLIIEKTGLNFTFFDERYKSKIYGKIEYDKENKILSISNVGELCLADFLLGGLKDQQTNLDLIGHFGEGMKLAILAFCRLNKNVTIISSNKKYTFLLKEDKNFKKESKYIKCLHCKIENLLNDDDYNEYKNQVKVLINNINEDEWQNEINNYLWLIERNIEIYTTFGKKGKECGQILCEDYLKKKLYVKGIYVKEITNDNYTEFLPGFNSYNVETNRDRDIVQDDYQLKKNLAEIISEFLNSNYKKPKHQKKDEKISIKENYSDIESSSSSSSSSSTSHTFKKIFESLINCLERGLDIFDTNTLCSKLSNDSKNYVWEKESKKHKIGEQPVCWEQEIIKFIKKKKLTENFYPYYIVNNSLYQILKDCSKYESIEDRYSKFKKEIKIIPPDAKHQKALNKLYDILKVILKKDKIKNIQFNEFQDSNKNFCFSEDNKYILHSEKLKENSDNKWTFWILVKIMNLENKNIEDYYENIYDLFQRR